MHKGQKCDEHGRSCEADNINGVLKFGLRFLSGVCAWNSHDELPRANAPSDSGFPLAAQRTAGKRVPADVERRAEPSVQDEVFHCRHEFAPSGRFGDARRPRTWAFDCGVSAVDQVGNTALCQPCAKQGAITVAERMVEDGPGQTIVLSEDHGVVQRVCRRQRGTRSFELLSDVHDDKGLVLNDED